MLNFKRFYPVAFHDALESPLCRHVQCCAEVYSTNNQHVPGTLSDIFLLELRLMHHCTHISLSATLFKCHLFHSLLLYILQMKAWKNCNVLKLQV